MDSFAFFYFLYRMSSDSKYFKRGVSSSKEDVHSAIQFLDKGLFPKSFCKVIPDFLDNDPEKCLIMHADGAGTKSSLAYIYWKETGDMDVWKGIAQDAIVMNTDDLLCSGLSTGFLLSSTIGRNKHRIPGEIISAVIEGTEAFCENLRSNGVEIYLTGGETADVGDLVQTIIVDSSIIAKGNRKDIINNSNISSGDVIVSFSSFGQSKYESKYNSGIGSNGLTSARHDLFNESYGQKYPESYDKENLTNEVAYTGKFKVTDTPFSGLEDLGKLVLSPTRTYLPVGKAILESYRDKIHGMIHCSGGGQTKCLHFIEDLHVIKNNLPAPPPIFNLIHSTTGTSFKEMYAVFNMGYRLEIYTDEKTALSIIKIASEFGIDASITGYCEKWQGKKLTLNSPEGLIEYS